MALTAQNIPAHYPQPLGMQILKAEAQRQTSMLRQEFATELLSVLGEIRESSARQKLLRMLQAHLKAGLSAAGRAEATWPKIDEVKKAIEARPETKPAVAGKQLRLFEQLDKVHQRSSSLLMASFGHIQVILERLNSREVVQAAPKGSASPPTPVKAVTSPK